MPHPTYLYLMKNLLIAFLFNFLCVSVQSATLDFAFQLGEKQEPRLDKLLPDVARQMAFSSDSKKLVAKGIGGIVVKWDVQSQRKLKRIGHGHLPSRQLQTISLRVVKVVILGYGTFPKANR